MVLLYHLNKATSSTYVIRGGNSGNGLLCGVFYVHLGHNSGAVDWYRGAALSFKPISDYIL